MKSNIVLAFPPPFAHLCLTARLQYFWGYGNIIDMTAKPWDILDPSKRTNEEKGYSRMDICNKCEYLIQNVSTCKKCGCFMTIKTRIEEAYCPIGKW
jgi:hypothetical protein